MRRVFIALMAGVCAAWSPAVRAAATTTTVHVFDTDFSANPRGSPVIDPVILVGDSIRWQFDASNHTTTSARGTLEQWDSGFRSTGSSFNHTFTHAGTFEYYCAAHGFDAGNGHAGGMAGMITVRPVPEPGALAVVPAAAVALLRRRRG